MLTLYNTHTHTHTLHLSEYLSLTSSYIKSDVLQFVFVLLLQFSIIVNSFIFNSQST